ncbi:MAG: type II toxin-antitoxin system PemK/MazF family toxin [Betaproteobacteria bacterium]|nr:type II toxin-antitoxin system PemK/MazF family toxin [Betaproteobacteria bacterium]
MPPTIAYSFGDVVLVPFPFTDQSTSKKRPAVVVSSAAYHGARPDIVIMAITSQMRPAAFGEVMVSSWQAAGLLKPSAIKPVITTIERSLVIRAMGKLPAPDSDALRAALASMLG